MSLYIKIQNSGEAGQIEFKIHESNQTPVSCITNHCIPSGVSAHGKSQSTKIDGSGGTIPN